MKIIVPMAGRGSRLRPHSLTVPKPLIPVAGQPIVHRLVKDIVKVLNQPIDEIAFILGELTFFGEDVVASLEALATSLGAKASIYRQDQPLGTGHAIMCAKESLSGPAVIAYADTLIRANFSLDPDADAVIWVKQVDKPEAFGVVKLNDRLEIIELVEKPKDFVSDLAVIGIYYFKDVSVLKQELQYVLDNNIVNGGEYQINDGIKGMMAKGNVFKTGQVDEWMDCGNKAVTVETNARMLRFLQADGDEQMVAPSVKIINSKIIEPCFIGEHVVLNNATIGPNVSIGKNCVIENTTITNSLVQTNSTIKNAHLENAMIGNYVSYDGNFKAVSLGDYSVLE
ncbi:MAG: nucleotidyltransferase [Flavobacteriales bacterium]|nr:nucleotidyltransferase [Flavobacteriia bacterium]NCP06103.1 nucleotidyltransferase [Flavobacteriales bacterium]PIV94558.1 MAG: nucleotidyltransferase [Flavobacteriaceae bacterium CG17_big_fil_post_rev_8_21_14_2_50_33_15]PIY10519.1 MAG: nucleotidyltransferase [Flavobacteriaceae bacterium CG_4_10_14_3_um_filter_33_47]PJB16376.1 MAG: nucleotidyltransferase [Flavobacteriaceae bacterium CG_4_9_14_3_um_filter_33_16]